MGSDTIQRKAGIPYAAAANTELSQQGTPTQLVAPHRGHDRHALRPGPWEIKPQVSQAPQRALHKTKFDITLPEDGLKQLPIELVRGAVPILPTGNLRLETGGSRESKVHVLGLLT